MADRFSFRAWVNGKMWYSENPLQFNYMEDGGGGMGFFAYSNALGLTETIPEGQRIIMQCTGLKDKNGTLIYEGDVVEKLVDMRTQAFQRSTVINCQAMWKLLAGDKNTSTPLGWPSPSCLEVLGNVHENPELMNEPKGTA